MPRVTKEILEEINDVYQKGISERDTDDDSLNNEEIGIWDPGEGAACHYAKALTNTRLCECARIDRLSGCEV